MTIKEALSILSKYDNDTELWVRDFESTEIVPLQKIMKYGDIGLLLTSKDID